MTPSIPRVLLMCLALAFASAWLGCGPDLTDDAPGDAPIDLWAPEFSEHEPAALPDDELPCACGGESEDAD